ncbi:MULTISPECIES: S8 family peptidase [Aneurinibacillus]|uniref:S8 family peptidase n=1 Tax=Aneurinibacillus thermoaerophilus TaxID=143495 RepID=A0A1G7ZKZ8_ANETH|nr:MULTISPECIES: S8 family peptidase [Aneurinibacillus]AMA72432.1 peptidase S8 [Aneurinibacillus sp. XH2]MED0675689.1 S8 family peptidase [Aneurinibacillus thermoaerophilus]MED0679907.1 S8 family peptidase [Aneurinibacillus thermoaerophilus]MED0735590.1 S8 family peptidase [Aneurinibacillus thermoaerophilus]MED0758787.1 S8 family peptidase [Aneurinibacillus thermoaerophilus]
MRNFTRYAVGGLAVIFAGACFLLAQPEQSEAPPKKPDTSSVSQQTKPHKFYRINYISGLNETRTRLNNSEHVITIHHNSNETSHYMKREVTVKFKRPPSPTELKQMIQAINGWEKARFGSMYIFKSRTMSADELIAYFNKRPNVQFAEPNYLLLPNATPNDMLYPRYQWNMPAINMEQAWDISKGRENVIIAVIDTGVDLTHPEFQGKLVKGHNVLNDSDRPQDDNGHGTHVAGIIAAKTNNREGIAGIAWNNKIMPIKGIGSDGSGSSFDIARGIIWAADHGASVINMSVGNYHPSNVLHDAIKYAFSKNVVMVAASGNDHTSQPSFPAAYPEVISVAAIDWQGNQANFSNYGSYIDVAAPGVDIPSTYVQGDYASLSGTSMACPHVAGLAGLIRSLNPELNNSEVMKIIRAATWDAGQPGWDHYYGYGIVNVPHALQLAGTHTQNTTPSATKPTQKNTFWEQLQKLFP